MRHDIEHLKAKAKLIRFLVLKKVFETGKGHIGGTYSCTELLTALYYGGILRVDPQEPMSKTRDRLILGKGHACLALYGILVDLGFFSAALLDEYGSNGSRLGGQTNIDTPGIEYNSGSLGHAIGVGAGMALAARMDGFNYRALAIVGDGECGEGSIWESVMFASRQRLSNLIVIVDRNRQSVTDFIEDDDGSGRLDDKFKACGWECRTIDGHSFEEILETMSGLDELDKPLAIVADTVKGKGISFMESGLKWHHSVPTRDEYEKAARELGWGS
ncbi:MAG: transketolase [Syntrophobacteraceae bacterium]